MKYGSVCSGIEAATVAWHPLGWEPVFFSEIEPFPCAVLAHHYPHVPNLGDMTKFERWSDHAIDLLVGGTPCQDYSVAGLRAGMDGDRGQLTLVFVKILGRYRPTWFAWENVPGVLSSNGGRDFARFLGELTGRSVEPPEDGWKNAGIVEGAPGCYGIAWRVLDAQFTRTCEFPAAVPQRRRRVFVVGYLEDWRAAAAVLFDAESLQGNSAPRRQAGQGTARDVAQSLVSSGRGVGRAGETRGQDPVVAVSDVIGALNNSGGNAYPGQTLQDATVGQLIPTVANPLTARMHKGVNTTGDEGQTMIASAAAPSLTGNPHGDNESREGLLVAHALRAEGFDASEDGSGRGTPLVPVADTLTAGMSKSAARMPQEQGALVPIAIQERAISENPDAGPDGAGVRTDGAAYTLEARQVPQAVAFAENSRGEVRLAGGNGAVAPQLSTGGGKPGQGHAAIAENWRVRRLMPRECERLQAFPDDYTRVPGAGGGWRDVDPEEDLDELRALGLPLRLKGNQWRVSDPDGPRYKALGNSMAVNVMQWLGERIALVDQIIRGAA